MKNATRSIVFLILFGVMVVYGPALWLMLHSGSNVVSSSSMLNSYSSKHLLHGGLIWHAQSPPQYPEWVEIDYSSPKKIKCLAMQAQGDGIGSGNEYLRMPKDFIFQASNDRNTWVDLLKVSNNIYNIGGEWKRWNFQNKNNYRHYRIYITANSDPNLLTIQQIGLDE